MKYKTKSSRKNKRQIFLRLSTLALVAVLFFKPKLSDACACGCGIFDIGTNAMLPTSAGGMVFFEYNFLDQNSNHSGTGSAPAANNNDKEIKTHFFKIGGQYLFNREWGVQADIPYWSRLYNTTDTNGNPQSFSHAALGDIRVKGIYTGFSENMSTGVTFGLKLPTGDYSYPNFDPDTEIGTGSTDLMLGAYHLGKITQDQLWNYFVNVNFNQPVLTLPNYIPGNELTAAFGVYYAGFNLGQMDRKIMPIVELLTAFRGADEGANGDSLNSGYRRLLISPGFEVELGRVRIYADVSTPLAQYYNGNQLSAPVAYKLAVMVNF